jgi:hypothetical protein
MQKKKKKVTLRSPAFMHGGRSMVFHVARQQCVNQLKALVISKGGYHCQHLHEKNG